MLFLSQKSEVNPLDSAHLIPFGLFLIEVKFPSKVKSTSGVWEKSIDVYV